MEITFTQQQGYLLKLDARDRRELADYLDITEKHLIKLVNAGDLYDEHGDELTTWITDCLNKAKVTHHEDIEIDKITA